MAMKKHERLLEEYEDAYFALLMEEVAKKEGERLEALNEALQSDPEAAVPESLDHRCMETIRRHFAHRQRRSALRRTGKVLRLAAVLMAVTMLLFTTAFAVSEEFRASTINLILTVTRQYTQFDISHGAGNLQQTTSSNQGGFTYFQTAEIGWIPDGYTYCDGEYNGYAIFKNESGAEIIIIIEPGNSSINVDTEDPDHMESITINDNEGLCITKANYVHIITVDLENYLYIDVAASDSLSIDTVKKIVENISIFPQ